MKNLEKLFLRLNDREQTLLVVAVWVVFLVAAFKTLQSAVLLSEEWSLTSQSISSHETVIGLKPVIDAALELQKQEQQNKSYDKKNLSNASSLAAVFPQRDYRSLIPMFVTYPNTSRDHL